MAKASARKPSAKTKPKAAASKGQARKPGGSSAKGRTAKDRKAPEGAGDVIVKMLESPLAVDLIAVGATAALAAIAESRFGRRSGDDAHKGALKAAGAAATAAMGRRIAHEIDAILQAAKETRDAKEE